MIPNPQLPAIPMMADYVSARDFLFEILSNLSANAVNDNWTKDYYPGYLFFKGPVGTGLAQNSQLYYDVATHRLGVGLGFTEKAPPTRTLEVNGDFGII